MTVTGPDVGLAAVRLSLGPATLVTVTRDHVALRTPSRPDFWDGNMIQLLSRPDDLRPWAARYRSGIGATVGVQRMRVMWPDADLDGRAPAGVEELDVNIESMRLSTLESLVDVEPASVDLSAASTDKDWHAHSVLPRHDAPEVTQEFWTWRSREVRANVLAGRADVWLARKAGIPIARASIVYDRQGLAAVDDVATHPVYRGAGVATTLVHHAVRSHLDRRPGDTMVVLAEPFSAGERVYRRLGFRPGSLVVQADRPL